jgi:hypothetical protein
VYSEQSIERTESPIMAARAPPAGRAGGRFAQFKLVLLGEDQEDMSIDDG